jgi:hypothetical protein
MTQDIKDLERDIEESRARLDLTIDRLQDRLSVSGIVDDLLGSMHANRYGSILDHTLAVIRKNPVPVMLVATGVGWLIHRMTRDSGSASLRHPMAYEETADVPVIHPGDARVYDPDTSTLHPMQDTLESRRELNARA